MLAAQGQATLRIALKYPMLDHPLWPRAERVCRAQCTIQLPIEQYPLHPHPLRARPSHGPAVSAGWRAPGTNTVPVRVTRAPVAARPTAPATVPCEEADPEVLGADALAKAGRAGAGAAPRTRACRRKGQPPRSAPTGDRSAYDEVGEIGAS